MSVNERLVHPELKEIERQKRIREEEEQYANRDDVKMMSGLHQEHLNHHSKVEAASINQRYDVALQQAEAKVLRTIEGMEKRLEHREAAAVQTLHRIMVKRPGRIASLFSAGKATKAWRKAVDGQKAVLSRIRSRKSTVFKIRTQQSNYRSAIRNWIRNRAIRLDPHAIREHEAEQERRRQELEIQRIEKARALAQQRGKTIAAEIPRGMTMQRTHAKP